MIRMCCLLTISHDKIRIIREIRCVFREIRLCVS